MSSKATIVPSWINKSGVVYSNLSAAQRTPTGFIIVGTVHFNPGRFDFDDDRFAAFALRNALITVRCEGCRVEYDSIAYREQINETRSVEVSLKTSTDQKTSGSSAASGRGAFKPTGITVGGEAHGNVQKEFGKQSSRNEAVKEQVKKILVSARPQANENGELYRVDWEVRPDELTPLLHGGNTFNVVHGERMRQANQGAGLARIETPKPGGKVEITAIIRKKDFEWLDWSLPGRLGKLVKDGEKILSGKNKRAIVGRAALGKALEGEVVIQTLLDNSK